MEKYKQFINGEFVDAISGKTRLIYNPATEEPIAEVPLSGREDALAAIAAARKAFDSGPWPGMSIRERAKYLYRVVENLKDMESDLAMIESMDAGATIRKTTMMDIPVGIEHMNLLVELAERMDPYEPLPWIDFPKISWNFANREPIGVTAGIIPWNFPFMMVVWKAAPALIMGNASIVKPASETPLSALKFAQAVAAADLPPGVFNLITGPGSSVGEELASNPGVDKVAITGSTETGRRIMHLASDTVKKVTLELGGKSPTIVLEDADLEQSVDGTLFGVFFHAGQVCESGTRAFIPASRYDEFMEKLKERVGHIKIGDPQDFETTMGPVISKAQYERVMGYIEKGRQEGARLVTGGRRPDGFDKGFFIEPTVFENVNNDMTIAREEIFGPVLSVIKYDSEDNAIAMANDSIYGLGGAVFSTDIPHAIEVAKQIRTGTVWINDYHLINALAPFGGFKQSGVGRELGTYGLKEYTQVKHIHVDLTMDRSKKFWYDYIFDD